MRDSPSRSDSAVKFCYRQPGNVQAFARFCRLHIVLVTPARGNCLWLDRERAAFITANRMPLALRRYGFRDAIAAFGRCGLPWCALRAAAVRAAAVLASVASACFAAPASSGVIQLSIGPRAARQTLAW